jgi:hypothetical protein
MRRVVLFSLVLIGVLGFYLELAHFLGFQVVDSLYGAFLLWCPVLIVGRFDCVKKFIPNINLSNFLLEEKLI